MGQVLSIGVELAGTTRSPRLDAAFRQSIYALVAAADSQTITNRERLHVGAIQLLGDGYSVRYSLHFLAISLLGDWYSVRYSLHFLAIWLLGD